MVHLIGTRWAPGLIERRDTSIGLFEVMNCPMTTRCELEVQGALLRPARGFVAERIEQARTAQRVIKPVGTIHVVATYIKENE